MNETKFPATGVTGMSGNHVVLLPLKGARDYFDVGADASLRNLKMNHEPTATNPSHGWWKAFLDWIKSWDYSSYDYLADRMKTLEKELAQLKRAQSSCAPPKSGERA